MTTRFQGLRWVKAELCRTALSQSERCPVQQWVKALAIQLFFILNWWFLNIGLQKIKLENLVFLKKPSLFFIFFVAGAEEKSPAISA